MKKFFLALCVCAGLCACSDDAIDGVGSSSITLDGNDVYLTVRLNDVGSSTRATSPTDYPFTYGTQDEYQISTAHFYFFDEDGLFVSRAEVTDFSDVGGNPSESVEGQADGNIEFRSNTVVVLKGLTDNKFPRYMVTVLNEPSGFEGSYFEPAATLDEFQTKLANATDAIYQSEGGNFVMSTSAYATPTYTGQYAADGVSDISPWYFVTPINEENFSLEPIGDLSNYNEPVDVYVERLAAKVEVDVSAALAATALEKDDAEDDTHYVYRLEETIAGLANEDDQIVQEGNGTEVEATDHLYVEFLGWALNGTARNSNIVKNITGFVDASGQAEAIESIWAASEWNDATNFRSYWGKSYNYGIEHEYPTSNSTGNVDADENGTGTQDPLDEYLKYTSLLNVNTIGDATNNIAPDYEYCAENTNTTDILIDKRSSAITNALVKARIWMDGVDANGDSIITTGDIVRFEGELFTADYFIDYINRRVTEDVALYRNLYYASVPAGGLPTFDEGTGYTLAELEEYGISELSAASDEGWLTLENAGNGSVKVELDEDAMEASVGATGYLWFERVVATEASDTYAAGDTVYYAVNMLDGDTEAQLEADIRSAIDSYNTDYEMIGYVDGLMYYSIPIEHLNNDYQYPDAQEIKLFEGNYGIVRNHWYQISLASLSNVGKGIWDEEEVIIPDPTEPQSYYVEADIQLLSWKMVQQSADL